MFVLDLIGAILIVLTAFLAEKASENWKKPLWILFPTLVFAQAGIQIYSRKADAGKAQSERQEAIKETSDRVTKDVTKAVSEQYQETIRRQSDKISELQQQVRDMSSQVKVIRQSNIVTGSKPVKVEVTNSARGPETPPAVVQHVQITQRQVPSTRDDAPYGLEVTLQTDVTQEHPAFVIECDAEITEGNVSVTGSMIMTNVRMGVLDNKKQFYFSLGTPPFTPQTFWAWISKSR